MTREMIIEQLERHRQEFALDHGWNVSVLESLDAAIKLLKQEHCEDAISREYLVEHIKACWTNGRPMYSPDLSELLSWIDDVPLVQPKPIECEDTISRQALLNEIEKVCFGKDFVKFRIDNGSNGTRDYMIKYIKDMPSAQPEQKMGKWIETRIRISSGDFTRGVKCSKCGYETIVDDFKYCPNCGNPKMEEGEEY